jgi:integrase
VALLTGMRNGELFALKWSDVDLDKGLITVQRSYNKRTKEFKSTKAGYWRTVPISGELKQLLIDMRTCSSVGEGLVLNRMRSWDQGQQAKVLKEFCRMISITPIKFHTLRACTATHLISEGVEPVKVMKVCGWQDLKTMARYLRLSGVEEKGVTDGLRLLIE